LLALEAAVAVDLVPVVALFHALVDDAVAALRRLAGVRARVGVDLVPVVAGLHARLDRPVAAARGLAGHAVVRVVGVAVVAGLARTDLAVAAGAGLAHRGAGLAGAVVGAVVARLLARPH